MTTQPQTPGAQGTGTVSAARRATDLCLKFDIQSFTAAVGIQDAIEAAEAAAAAQGAEAERERAVKVCRDRTAYHERIMRDMVKGSDGWKIVADYRSESDACADAIATLAAQP